VLQHVAISLEERFGRAAVLPHIHRARFQFLPVFNHQLQRIGQEKLALGLDVTLHQRLDGAEKRRVIFEIVDADHRLVRYEALWLLDEAINDLRLVGRHHAEAAWIFDLLHEDYAVVLHAGKGRKVGVGNRIGEDDQHRLLDVLLCQVDRVRLPLQFLLLDVARLELGVDSRDVLAHLITQVADDKGYLADTRVT
jgi:hypothetical protein